MKDELASSGLMFLNISLIKELGIKPTLFLEHLKDKLYYVEKNNEFFREDWFCFTFDEAEKCTGFKRKSQECYINKLVKSGLIEKKVMGIPAKRYFRLLAW